MQIPQIFKKLGWRGVGAVIAMFAVVVTGIALAPTAPAGLVRWDTAWAAVGVGFGWCVRFMGPGVIFTVAAIEVIERTRSRHAAE